MKVEDRCRETVFRDGSVLAGRCANKARPGETTCGVHSEESQRKRDEKSRERERAKREAFEVRATQQAVRRLRAAGWTVIPPATREEAP